MTTPPEHYKTVEEKLRALEDALKSFLENPHCETTISEGKHVRYGFCRTCADQYGAGMLALLGRKS
jgi:hypothetical protein